MVIKTYFDVSWTGPEVQVDAAGNTTKLGEVKGEFVDCPSSPLQLPQSIVRAGNAVTPSSSFSPQLNC
jgi:hypothetical protein